MVISSPKTCCSPTVEKCGYWTLEHPVLQLAKQRLPTLCKEIPFPQSLRPTLDVNCWMVSSRTRATTCTPWRAYRMNCSPANTRFNGCLRQKHAILGCGRGGRKA